MDENEKEVLVLSREAAAQTAVNFGKNGRDPDKSIEPSLLSAEHIDYYVRATGLIGPYYEGGGKKARLKKAAYEGRIGGCAYEFNVDGHLVDLDLKDRLKVPAESIVFVECDLEFRLPEFIALRFNLQIRHVHRGLLLGTGPLVDPGYWGKLCIPLHNLTDQDYEIPLDEGLIWLEFTKTTSDLQESEKPLGRPPLDKEFWDIRDFIHKARTPFNGWGEPMPIRSSIPTMVKEANATAFAALDKSVEALAASATATEKAGGAETQVDTAKALFNRIGWLGASVAAAAVVTLWATFVGGVLTYYLALDSRLNSLDDQFANLPTSSELQESADLVNRINTAENEVSMLRQQNNILREELTEARMSLNELREMVSARLTTLSSSQSAE